MMAYGTINIRNQTEEISSNLVNAKPVSTASIGGRTSNNLRSLVGTYYSFLMYDKALSDEDILKNFNVNKTRYGVGAARK